MNGFDQYCMARASHDYRPLVQRTYASKIASMLEIPSELRRALKAHERLPTFMERVALELAQVQDLRVTKGKAPVSEATIVATICDMTEVFISSVLMEANRKRETDLARVAREAELQYQRELEQTASGTPTGEFAEAGVSIVEQRGGGQERNAIAKALGVTSDG
jgi:hypothetical protein